MSTALKVSTLHGVKIYNCSAGRTLPQWYDEAQKKGGKSLRYNREYRERIELIQDFNFKTAAAKVKMSPDGNYIFACGVYKPQIKVFDTANLSLKFERHADSEIVQFQVLSDDWSKFVALRADRTIEVHTHYGLHHKVRIPKFGRDMAYHFPSCDVYVAGSSSEVYRLNLDQGQFLAPLETSLSGINKIGINPVHQMIGLAGDGGLLECWDSRDRERIGILDIPSTFNGVDRRLHSKLTGCNLTGLRFGNDGLTMAVGTSTGHCVLYDIRSSKPLLWKDHRYGLPITNIKFHDASKKIITADRKVIKIWDKNDGTPFTSVEPTSDINHVCVAGDSGLMMVAGEQEKMMVYYIPEMGHAPRWCSFLENLTEEMEETSQSALYDDYKFVSREELEEWYVEGMEVVVCGDIPGMYWYLVLRVWKWLSFASSLYVSYLTI